MIWKLPKRRTVIKIILITTAILVTIFNMVVVIPQYPQYTWQFMLNLSTAIPSIYLAVHAESIHNLPLHIFLFQVIG